jgi:ParB-like chromosome segregation protein Spo0J
LDRVGIASPPSTDEGAANVLPVRGESQERRVVAVPLTSLRTGYSPRLGGEDRAHISRLAEVDVPLPPILVDRRSMRVIDGMHRLLAASLRGQETVDVEFYDGSPVDAFLRAVEANVKHGLPLSLADRRAAAARIVISHPQMSDRAIGEATGLSAKTVAGIRRRSPGSVPQVNARVGKDGRVRPLNNVEGRQRAAALLREHPEASLREVARGAGIAPATARDVRRRLARGEGFAGPRPGAAAGAREDAAAPSRGPVPGELQAAPSAVNTALGKLLRDPSLRHNEHGRQLLRLLQINAVGLQEWSGVVAAVPPHCVGNVGQIARQNARMWQGIVQELEERLRVNDPWAGRPTKQSRLVSPRRHGQGPAPAGRPRHRSCLSGRGALPALCRAETRY